MFCTNCGFKNDEHDIFCANCGMPLEIESSATQEITPTPAPSPIPTPAPTPSFAQSENPTYIIPNIDPPISTTIQQSNNSKSRKKTLIALIAALVVIVIGVASAITTYALGMWTLPGHNAVSVKVATEEQDQNKETTKDKKQSDTKKTPKKKDSNTSTKQNDTKKTRQLTLNKKYMDALVAPYGADAAVSVVYGKGENQSYDSSNARVQYTAAGLYAGVYVAALYNGVNNDTAHTMMSSMDNGAANNVIQQLGGRQAVNSTLEQHNYHCTAYGRDFGDTTATTDNLSCSEDAARMLMKIADASQSNVFGYDLASEGLSAPLGATMYGHRGQGINNAYNFFIIVQKDKHTVAISVMTKNRGKDSAVALTEGVLSQINTDILTKQTE